MDQAESASATSSLVGATVIAGGVLAAMVFRAPQPPPDASRVEPERKLRSPFAIHDAEGGGAETGVVMRDRNSLPPADISGKQGLEQSRRGNDPRLSESTPRELAAEPPSMPSQYGALSNRSQNSPYRREREGGSFATDHPRGNPAPHDSSARDMIPRRRGPRIRSQHEVRGNDSLESISRRYYGHANMAEAIYQANQHLLPSRTLLPVRTILKLPPVDSSLATSAGSGVGAAHRPGEKSGHGSTSHAGAPLAGEPHSGQQSPEVRTTLGSVR